MIPWQTVLANAITKPQELIEILELDSDLLPAAQRAAALFPLRVPRGFVQRMQKKDPKDPLLLQVLPLGFEEETTKGFIADPLQESKANPLPGLLHKYYGRVLLTITGACAINCRFCFRREFPYNENKPGREEWDKVLAYIAADPTITEVILSGGDPLVASDTLLARLIHKLAAISSLKTVRIHTRMPIVLPERITSELVQLLKETRLQALVVLHCNHPNELDDTVKSALQRLRYSGIMLLNQTVLLREINDAAPIICQLSEKLFAMGVLPYYLHLLDRVKGVAHFEVPEKQALDLMKEVLQRLPGYLVPKLVREVPGFASKKQLVVLE